jgi:ethanolamine ammonia-lyase small subunit
MNDWKELRKLTSARIGIGRTGFSVPTREHLKFQLDHARARDAVRWPWDVVNFAAKLKSGGIPSRVLQTCVESRDEYLTRPDLGRVLRSGGGAVAKKKSDIAIVVSNGLSSSGVENHGILFLKTLWRELEDTDLSLSPVYLIENARVAISDVVGSLAKAKMVLMILGERPGLSSFDSLGLYLTYAPRTGNSDANRNCISNIRPPEGLSYIDAVRKTLFLVNESFRRKISGVELKEEAELLR